MNEKINLYDTLVKIINNNNHITYEFYINRGHATLVFIDEAKKMITFRHGEMMRDIVIAGDTMGELVEFDDIKWKDQGEHFDIRILERVDIKSLLNKKDKNTKNTKDEDDHYYFNYEEDDLEWDDLL